MLLYIMHFFFAFTARMWDMGIILLLAALSDNSLTLVAFGGFLSSLFIVLFMSSIGHALDKTNRLVAAQYALSFKLLSLSFAYILCAYLSYLKYFVGQPIHDNYLLYVIPVVSAIANLTFCTVSQSVEKDWIVVLANENSPWLSITNSRMTQIDSGCNAFAPALTGLLFVQFSQTTVAIILLVTNAASTILLYVFMHSLYYSWPSLAFRGTSKSQKSTKSSGKSSNDYQAFSDNQTKSYFHDFMHSGCAGTMISYAFLYLTVLNFGSMMTVYLRSEHVSDAWIGMARGAGAFTGLIGATIFPYITDCIGIYRSSNLSLLFQLVLVLLGCSSFFVEYAGARTGVTILCVTVLLSRTGLWMFDLGVRQIAQETIPEHCRGKVNGQWKSMTSFFEMSSYIIAATTADARYFWVLAVISSCMVGSAFLIFTFTRPDLYPPASEEPEYEKVSVEMA